MGVSQSLSNQVAIALDSEGPFAPNSAVAGSIYMDIRDGPIEANALQFLLVGEEFSCAITTKVEQYADEDGVGYRTVITEFKESRKFLEVSFPIATFADRLGSGHYEFPFVLHLPANLPGRQGVPQRDVAHFYVRYFLYVHLDLPYYLISRLRIANSHELFVSKPSRPRELCPSLFIPVTKSVYQAGKFLGSVSLVLMMDDIHIEMGQSVQFRYAICNQSLAKFSYVNVELKETLQTRGKGVSSKEEKVIFRCQRSLSNVLGAKPLRETDSLPTETLSSTTSETAAARLQQSWVTDSFVLPKCHTSYYGSLASRSHTLVLHLQAADYTVIHNVRYELSQLRVMKAGPSRRMTGVLWPEKPQQERVTHLPGNWRPRLFPTAIIRVTDGNAPSAQPQPPSEPLVAGSPSATPVVEVVPAPSAPLLQE